MGLMESWFCIWDVWQTGGYGMWSHSNCFEHASTDYEACEN